MGSDRVSVRLGSGSGWRVSTRTFLTFEGLAGTAPLMKASGTKKIVMARYARNKRLGDAAQQWAFSSMRGSAGAKTYYQQLRARGTVHQAALRQLANRWIGILHGCLKHGTTSDEHTAWSHILNTAA